MTRRLVLLCAAGALSATSLRAQRVAGLSAATTESRAVVEFLWEAKPAVPLVIPRNRARCAPAECFSQFVATRANARWELQVRLTAPPAGFTVDLTNPTTPATRVARLQPGVWTPVGISGIATRGFTAEVTVQALRANGPAGRTPTVAELAPLFEYRAIRRP